MLALCVTCFWSCLVYRTWWGTVGSPVGTVLRYIDENFLPSESALRLCAENLVVRNLETISHFSYQVAWTLRSNPVGCHFHIGKIQAVVSLLVVSLKSVFYLIRFNAWNHSWNVRWAALNISPMVVACTVRFIWRGTAGCAWISCCMTTVSHPWQRLIESRWISAAIKIWWIARHVCNCTFIFLRL